MDNIKDNKIYLYEYENTNILCKNIQKNSKIISIEEFKNQFNQNSLNYINFFPNIFEDAGRKFANENNLIKSANSYK